MVQVANLNQVLNSLAMHSRAAFRAGQLGVVKAVQTRVAPKLKGEGADRTPTLWRVLQRSATITNHSGGAAVGFGGQASEYAEAVHEDDTVQHTGPRQGKYVYLSGGPGVSRPGDLNPPRRSGIAQVVNPKTKRTQWVNPLGQTVRGRTGWWRYASVQYIQRRPASTKPKNPRGMAHWLFGMPGSAWESIRDWAVLTCAAAAQQAARLVIGRP